MKELYQMMISSGALIIDTKKYFTFSSGIKSPIYCDTRKLISFPEYRKRILIELVDKTKIIGDIDCVAGVATGGIAWGAWLADKLDKPFCYIRSEKKSHGAKKLVEGVIDVNSKILLVEDVVTTGKSLGQAAMQLKDISDKQLSAVCLFSYGFKESKELLSGLKIKLYPLMDLMNLINQIDNETEKDEIIKWGKDPWSWKNEN